MKKIGEMTKLSIFEVFEKMFFLFLEPLADEDIGPYRPHCRATDHIVGSVARTGLFKPLDDEGSEYDMEAAIRFEGSINGEIRILLSMDIVKTMIQNMLGLKEDEITTQRMEDCSKEAVNVICGNFLSKLDSTKTFNLSLPIFSKNNPPLPPFKKGGKGGLLGENVCRMDFDSDGGKVGIVATLSDQ